MARCIYRVSQINRVGFWSEARWLRGLWRVIFGLLGDFTAGALRNSMFRKSPEHVWSFEPNFKGCFGDVCNIFVGSAWRKESVADAAKFKTTDRDFWCKSKTKWPTRKNKQDDQERYENEVIQLHTVVGVLKRERKKNAKSNLTRMLNQLTLSVSEELYDRHKVVEVIERLERLRYEVMRILEELETAYSKLRDEEKERKTSGEIEQINEQVYRELSQARVIMLTQVSSSCNARNVVSGEKEKNQRIT